MMRINCRHDYHHVFARDMSCGLNLLQVK